MGIVTHIFDSGPEANAFVEGTEWVNDSGITHLHTYAKGDKWLARFTDDDEAYGVVVVRDHTKRQGLAAAANVVVQEIARESNGLSPEELEEYAETKATDPRLRDADLEEGLADHWKREDERAHVKLLPVVTVAFGDAGEWEATCVDHGVVAMKGEREDAHLVAAIHLMRMHVNTPGVHDINEEPDEEDPDAERPHYSPAELERALAPGEITEMYGR